MLPFAGIFVEGEIGLISIEPPKAFLSLLLSSWHLI